MNTLTDITILVSSCDLYEDAWMPFFKLLKMHWKDCPHPMALITEEKEYDCDFMDVKSIKTGKNISWTERIRYALDQVDTEFVLFFLEDFFLHKDVDVIAFDRALEIIRSQKDVGMIHFTPVEKNMPIIEENNLEEAFYDLPIRKRTLRTRVAVTLFRKEYFLRLLYKDESPWKYERESHIRSMFAGYRIVRQDYSLYPPTFYYILDQSVGIGITSRKWLEKTKPFLESQGIMDVNYNRLGILSFEERKVEKKVEEIGLREWIYLKFTHPIKRKLRHNWIVQDILNLKKYIKWWTYYKKLK